MNKQPKYLMQCDPRWSNVPYTIDGDPKETIGYSGCGPTCMAMILAEWVDPNITPVDTCRMAIEMHDRTANNGTAWSFFPHMAKKYGFDFQQTGSTREAVEAIKVGALVVCSMGIKENGERGFFTSSGHFILAWGVDPDGSIRVNDPISKARTNIPVSQAIFIEQCHQYFIFRKIVASLEGDVAVLQRKGLIKSPDYWLKNAVPGGMANGGYMQALILNFVAMWKIVNTFEEGVAVLQKMGLIVTPEYWLQNAIPNGKVKGEYAAKLIASMAERIR